MQIRLVSGGRDFTVTANGTATVTYTQPAVWKGSLGSLKLEATYTGTATLTYTAANGSWKEVADNTKVVTDIRVNDSTDQRGLGRPRARRHVPVPGVGPGARRHGLPPGVPPHLTRR